MTDLPPPRIPKSEPSVHLWLTHRWTAPIALAASAISMLVWTWGRYCDPFVDFGREIYVAWRLSAGDALYRDIDYFNGPLSPYLNALIFRIFGVSLLSLEIANLLWWTLLVAMAHRLYVAMSDRLSAFVATFLFIALFSFIQLTGTANYNFITPYAHEATHSLACAFAALALLWSYLRQPSRPYPPALIGIGLLLGIMFLMKVEVTVAAAASLVVGIGLRLRLDHARSKQCLGTLAIVAIAAIVPSIIAFVLLRLAMPSQEALRGLLGSWKYLFDARVTANPFYRKLMGTDKPWAHTVVMLRILAGELLLLSPPAIAAMLLRRNVPRQTRWLCTVGSAAYVTVLLWSFGNRAHWQGAVWPLNLIAVATALTFAVLVVRQKEDPSPRLILQFSFSVFAAVLLAKIFFNVVTFRYGFVLTAPAFALLVILLIRWIPELIHRAGGSAWVFRAAAMAALGCLCLKYLAAYENFSRSRPLMAVGTAEDQFGVYQKAEAINRVLNFLARLPPDQTLATVPEGAMINYLSRRINPTGELTLLPGEVEMFGEQRILGRFHRHPPDWIVFVQTDVSEFGDAGFGVDYAQEIDRFIKDNYDPTPLAAAGESQANLQLFKFDPGHRQIMTSSANPIASSPATSSDAGNSSATSFPAAGATAYHPQ
jgi:hypothetical protein